MSENSNMPILWQNALLQFSTEIGRKAWVWFAETRGKGMQYDADKYALEVEMIYKSTSPIFNAAQKIHNAPDEIMSDLMRFTLIRHLNWRLGGNVTPTWITG